VLIAERDSKVAFGTFRKSLGVLGDWVGCHQMPERSFFLHETQFPVCARCTGVLLAQTAVGLLAIAGHYAPLTVGFFLMIPMGLDWLVQYTGVYESTNARRFVTGIMGGAGYMTILVNVIVSGMEMFQQDAWSIFQ
jgi:uncharacterized membrane protein